MVRSVIRRITASDDSCVRGGLHGYKATGHAREKPNLPICARELLTLKLQFSLIKKKKLRFPLYLMQPGLRNNEFTYHGLTLEYSLPQSLEEWNWRFWSHCTGWCSESEPELDNTRVSNYPDPILTYKQSVMSMIWLSWVTGDYKHWTRDTRTRDPRTRGLGTQGPKDPESCGLCCTVAIKIQLYRLSVPMLRA